MKRAVTIRLEDDIWRALSNLAEEDERSVNSYLSFILGRIVRCQIPFESFLMKTSPVWSALMTEHEPEEEGALS